MDLKIPPQNIEAEQSVLGGLMLEQEAWDEIADLINEDDFYKPSHKKIFAAIKDLNKQNHPTDLVTVSNLLMDKKQLDVVGGPSYLAEMIDLVPSTANIATYAKIVHEKSLLRKIISLSKEISDQAYAQEFVDVSSFMDELESKVFNLAEQKQVTGLIDSSDLVKASLEKLEELYANQGQVTGVPTGFVEMDEMTAGFHPGELIIIAARPSMGKTAFSLNVALGAALKEKKSVAYFSVEMGKEQMMIRMLAAQAKIPLGHLRVGQLDDRSWPRLINSAASLSDANIFIDDTAGISPFEIRAKARRLKAKHGLDLIMVDYLQLMSLKQKVESREREVSEISKMLKAISKELQIPVVALAQLNRGVEGRSDRRPMLSDLRESGSIEQDADVIMMLYREDYYDRDNPDIKGISEIIIAKQRNGPTGTVRLRWQAEYGLFSDFVDGPEAPMPTTPFEGASSNAMKRGGGGALGMPPDLPPPGSPPKNYAPRN
ncbi:MAG: replicative DNA helicase [Bdellovibrionaceae bacterium]|nr:replicative DNA helicase [Pseudobdellovibrionaceae bacterium]